MSIIDDNASHNRCEMALARLEGLCSYADGHLPPFRGNPATDSLKTVRDRIDELATKSNCTIGGGDCHGGVLIAIRQKQAARITALTSALSDLLNFAAIHSDLSASHAGRTAMNRARKIIADGLVGSDVQPQPTAQPTGRNADGGKL